MLIVVDLTITKRLNGAGVLSNDADKTVDILLGYVNGFF